MPNPDEMQPHLPHDGRVLLDAEQTLALVCRKLNEARSRIADLEAAKVVQQALIDSHEHRMEVIEHILFNREIVQ
jgi:hypothetical protein